MPAIILDRDGVINYDSDEYIKSPDEWLPIPGSLAAMATLNQAGYHIYIATNQSGVARGLYDLPTLSRIHDKLHVELKKLGGNVTDIIFCPHLPQENCYCRKPKPGMLEMIQDRHGVKLDETYFIGDKFSDIEAANIVKCKPILVLTGYGQQTLQQHAHALKNVPQFSDLTAAVNFVLTEKKS